MTRYHPTVNLTSGATDFSSDLLDLTINQAITHKSPNIDFTVDNRGNQYNGVLEATYVPISCTVDGSLYPFFKGRLDTSRQIHSKREGSIFTCSGRGDFGALEDVITSLDFEDTFPNTIVTAIIAEYNTRKKSDDPTITIARDDAPFTGALSIQWKRKSCARMLYELQQKLCAPVAAGGQNKSYDFYLDTSDNFYFDQTGLYSSSINITSNTETMTSTHIIDRNPLRTEEWLVCNATAGRIPLNMQTGYNTYHSISPDPSDPWTENNASEWIDSGVNDWVLTGGKACTNSTTITPAVGSYEIALTTGDLPGVLPYWGFNIPFPANGSKWPAQDPSGGLNAYNETTASSPVASSMSESMGEMSAVMFYFSAPASMTPLGLFIRVTDGSSVTADSVVINYPPSGVTVPAWGLMNFPFGPSGGYTSSTVTGVDWENIVSVWICLKAPFDTQTHHTIYFDGFQIVKPLVVSAVDATATLQKTDVWNDTTISSFSLANAMAAGKLENVSQPQTYWTFDNLGRVDIPVGKTFTVDGSLTLLMRELNLKMSKSKGYLISAQAFEAT